MARRKLWLFIFLGATIVSAVAIGYDLYRLNRAEWHKPYSYHQIYERWLEPLARLPAKQKRRELTTAIQQYENILVWEQRDPFYWWEMGYLACLLSQTGEEEEKSRWRQRAFVAIANAIERMPTCGKFHYAHAFLQQGQQADQAMASAQMLLKHRRKIVQQIAQYWAQRWQHGKRQEFLALFAEACYSANRFQFSRYGERTILSWRKMAPEVSAWGIIFPAEEQYALAAARIFLQHRHFPPLFEILAHVSSPENMAWRMALEGHGYLYQGDFATAMTRYRQALAQSPANRELLLEITVLLSRLGNLQLALSLLEEQSQQVSEEILLEIRLTLFAQALAAGDREEVLPLLEKTSEHIPTNAQLDFLLAQAYWQQQRLREALQRIEKAVQQCPTTDEYTQLLCEILFALNWPEKAAWHLEKYGSRLARRAFFYDWLAQQYIVQKEFQRAEKWARKAAHVEPGNAKYHFRLEEIARLQKTK